jgi:hypothetical protein
MLIDPAEKLDFGFNWSTDSWLAGADTISASTWAVAPTGPTLSGEAASTTATSVLITACTHGKIYSLTNRVTTAAGRIGERTITIRCIER